MTACLLLACNTPSSDGSEPPKGAEPADVEEGKADPGVEEVHADPDAPAAGEVDENCEYKVKEECYTDKKAACEAAGCPDTCVVLESFPAQIACE